MKVLYDKREFIINITKEELLRVPPEKLAQAMLNKIENAMLNKIENAIYKECLETMIKGLLNPDHVKTLNTGCFNCKRSLWDMDGCTCKLTGLQVGNASLGCEHRKERCK